ncbi:MAG: hypothetical protein M3Y09_02790 [Actinomycetota bacterium]|nr:hypothetical protein [Actinomycetota bacterium]
MTRPAVQPALLLMPGATEGTTQWKAETLQMVNWGGFQGHAQMAISPGATLLSGASGTGKSTLLDAYLALMMPSDTPFNGASNDARTGRARGADQRNLLTYLRGKIDTSREAGTGELTDQVLRGVDSASWGAVAMTFADDNERHFTALRVYFVPRGATRSSEITMKMATIDGKLDLREMEALRGSHFDKRTLTTRWPEMTVHNTYSDFSQTLFTRLGIGAGGDGGKALRLLARIQGGQQVRTVDGLYKSMVLEEPATYAAADKAVGHFTDLDASFEAMVTEAEKARVLERLPELHREREEARITEQLIDTFGVHRDGDTPFLLWQLRAEDRLLETAVAANREKRRLTAEQFKAARELESELAGRVDDIAEQQKANGGDMLEILKHELEVLDGNREDAAIRRALFDNRTACLAISPASDVDFGQHRREAEAYLAGFDARRDVLERRQRGVRESGYPLSVKRDELQQEHDSLKGRSGLVPKRLHEARLAIARAAGIDPAELPFVAELIDIAAGEQQWRKAAEVTLFSAARVMLVDQARLEHLSAKIDPIRLPFRIQFEGVQLRPYADNPGDERLISGKLLHKNSPFTAWVRERVRRRGTDALCVNDPADLRGDGPRVTSNGQTRNGSRGAHGELGDAPIIGFSNAERLAQIAGEIAELDDRLGELGRYDQDLTQQLQDLWQRKQAHQYVADCEWASIDVAAIDVQIRDREAERDRILEANDVLQALQAEEELLRGKLEDAREAKFGADRQRKDLDAEHLEQVGRQDQITINLGRIENGGTARLTDAQAEHLAAVFASVGSPDDLDDFPEGVRRLRTRLSEDSKAARDKAQAATRSLCGIFEGYQGRWPDPNLGVTIESYSGYRDIFDNITATGLHERRQEWRRRLSEWSGQDLVPLNGAFDTAIEDIEDRLLPVNAILAELPFGPAKDRLRICLRRLNLDDITKFRRELKELSSGATQDLSDAEIELRFTRLRAFMDRIRRAETGTKAGSTNRDIYLDVRQHVEITAVRVNVTGVEVATYASLGGKSGGETQELIAFIVGAALRFQLGDEDRARPRFAPIFLDEGFVKSDSEFAGRAVNAWKGLGFQLIVGAPLDKVTALEPDMDLVLTMTKSPKGYSHITELRSAGGS